MLTHTIEKPNPVSDCVSEESKIENAMEKCGPFRNSDSASNCAASAGGWPAASVAVTAAAAAAVAVMLGSAAVVAEGTVAASVGARWRESRSGAREWRSREASGATRGRDEGAAVGGRGRRKQRGQRGRRVERKAEEWDTRGSECGATKEKCDMFGRRQVEETVGGAENLHSDGAEERG